MGEYDRSETDRRMVNASPLWGLAALIWPRHPWFAPWASMRRHYRGSQTATARARLCGAVRGPRLCPTRPAPLRQYGGEGEKNGAICDPGRAEYDGPGLKYCGPVGPPDRDPQSEAQWELTGNASGVETEGFQGSTPLGYLQSRRIRDREKLTGGGIQ
jgi:hypothetical protein